MRAVVRVTRASVSSSSCGALSLFSPAVASAAVPAASRSSFPRRCLAVASASSRSGAGMERSANTAELLDFDTARKDVNKWRKQLMYRSKQRGWLELDLIMGTWADENLHKLSVPQLEEYAYIVACENPDLIKSFVEKMPLPENLKNSDIAKQLVDYAQLQKKQWTLQTGNQ